MVSVQLLGPEIIAHLFDLLINFIFEFGGYLFIGGIVNLIFISVSDCRPLIWEAASD